MLLQGFDKTDRSYIVHPAVGFYHLTIFKCWKIERHLHRVKNLLTLNTSTLNHSMRLTTFVKAECCKRGDFPPTIAGVQWVRIRAVRKEWRSWGERIDYTSWAVEHLWPWRYKSDINPTLKHPSFLARHERLGIGWQKLIGKSDWRSYGGWSVWERERKRARVEKKIMVICAKMFKRVWSLRGITTNVQSIGCRMEIDLFFHI